MKQPKKDNRGGVRPGAGRKPKGDKPRQYASIRIDRNAYEAIPAGVNKCDYVSDIIMTAARKR